MPHVAGAVVFLLSGCVVIATQGVALNTFTGRVAQTRLAPEPNALEV